MNRTVTHSTVHIQQQHIDIHRNLIISSRIWQKYADKQQNNQVKKQQQHNNSIRQENVTNSWATKKKFTIYTQENEDLLQFTAWKHIYI